MSFESVRFVPSRVEGIACVTVVEVHGDKLLLHAESGVHVVRFAALVPPSTFGARLRHLLGRTPRMVGDRDWFRVPRDRFFRFDTSPPVTVYMPEDDVQGYDSSVFGRIRTVMCAGGFDTRDLG